MEGAMLPSYALAEGDDYAVSKEGYFFVHRDLITISTFYFL